jgi:hypothetical protein
MLESIFRQEYLAEFLDGGSVFNMSNCSYFDKWEDSNNNTTLYAGLDLGKRDDYTVLTIMDGSGKIYYIYRSNKRDWNLIIKDIIDTLVKYRVSLCLVEINNIGDVVFDLLKEKIKGKVSCKLVEHWTSNDSKQALVEQFQIDLNNSKLSFPSSSLIEEFSNEFSVFDFKFLKNKIVYGARDGFHDDIVMATMLANSCRKRYVGSGDYSAFLNNTIVI